MNHLETILKENTVSVYYDQSAKWLYLSWYGPQSASGRKYAFDQALDFLKTSGCTKILNDNTNNTSTWTDCALWVAEDWLPRAEQAGLKSLAWVYSRNPEVRQTAKDLLSRLSSKAIIIAFEDISDAQNWLHAV